jgi:hypothetical protein
MPPRLVPRGGGFVLPGRGFVGRIVPRVLRGREYPVTAARTAALTGITPQALYPCQELSGSLIDVVGGLNLAAAGTPTYQHQVADRAGIYYDASVDGHTANVNDLGAASGLYCAVVRALPIAPVTTYGLFGRGNAAVAECCLVYTTGGVNYVGVLIRDSGSNSLGLSDAALDVKTPTHAHLITLQIDRAAAVARLRVSRPGAVASAISGSIAGFATLSGAAQVYGHGAVPAMSGGNMVSWAMVAVGAQCEGADVPAAIARGLGWEV